MRPFTYTKPATPGEAVGAIAAGGPGARFPAGGTTLYDLMKLNIEVPSSIIDVNSLTELSGFDTTGSSELVFGAQARMSDVAADLHLMREYPALSESLWRAASQQLRNMASLGGNLLQRLRGPGRNQPGSRAIGRQRGLHRRLSRRLGDRASRIRSKRRCAGAQWPKDDSR
jgi:xanthine dehydrogenase YagS FAD-binding subunit